MARARWWLLPVLAMAIAGPAAQAAEITWQEAVARLAYERSQAEACVRILKKFGDKPAADRGEVAYDQAKADYDAVIAGLIAALAQREQPASLTDLQQLLQRGFEKREAFCRSVQPLIPTAPSAQSEKGVIDGIVSGVVGPVVDAIKAIFVKRMDENALARATIQTQLEATRWPGFASVMPSS
ncbi:MAG TPA: hypothetical protein VF213_00790 [Dongiaceae bacterium]